MTDILDRQYQLKKFFKLLYQDREEEEEYIRIFQNNNKDFQKISYFNNIDYLVKYATSKYVKYNNTYFTLATTNGKGGTKKDLLNRYFLAFDFDKKDYLRGFNHIDILNKFRDAKIHYHALVDSGNGYHVYVCINKTDDIDKVKEVQEALCDKLVADKNAIKTTQILRVPYTYNIKNGIPKQINIIYQEDRHKIKRYDIDFLWELNCNQKHKQVAEQTKITISNTNIPKCVQDLLINGSKKGDRYEDLQRIVVLLRQRNRTLQEVKKVCREWADKSKYDDNLEYRVQNIYDKLNYIKLKCKECKYKKECYNSVASCFNFSALKDQEGQQCLVIKYKSNTLSKCKGGSNKMLSGNQILLLNVLKNNIDGLFYSEIERKITFKKKCRLSKPTILKTLHELQNNGYITVTKGYKRGKQQNFYKINKVKYKADNTIEISYFATIMCVCRLITPSELRLYYIMRYLHHNQEQEGGGLKGNLFQVNQYELAKIYYGRITKEGQGHISEMLNNLLECHILDIWERQTSKNNGFTYNIYRLNS